MVDKYLVTENEYLSMTVDPADGHLKATRDNGDAVDFGKVSGDVTPEAIAARDDAIAAAAAAEAVGNTNDTIMAGVAADAGSAFASQLNASIGAFVRPRPLPLPAGFTWQDAPINLLWDGHQVMTDFDVRVYKSTGGKTVYMHSINGSDSNDGLTEDTPKKSLMTSGGAMSAAVVGDIVVLLDERVIWRADTSVSYSQPVTKGVGIVARHPGLKLPTADLLTYAKTAGQTNVWQAARSAVERVIDVESNREGDEFAEAMSLADCDATPGSWWTDGTTLYVHAFDSQAPDPLNVFALLNVTGFTFRSTVSALSLYVEGIDFYGGERSMLLDRAAGGTIDFYAYRCGFFHSTAASTGRNDNLVAAGARTVYLQECAAKHSNKDGANYSAYDFNNVLREVPHVIEVDCDMGENGLNQSTDLSCNASTSHNGSKVIRVRGTYRDSKGSVVADVHAGTQTVNVGIAAAGSHGATADSLGASITAGQGAEVWVFAGSALDSPVGIYAEADSVVHVDSAWYFSTGGPVEVTLAA